MYRKIIHLDLDAFFCSVEELKQPELRGKPFAVGGSADSRGVISSCSYAAREVGISSAMPTVQALRLCPNLILKQPDFSTYQHVSSEVMHIMGNLSPLFEQISIDEAFLDVSDLAKSSFEIARELQGNILEKLGLPSSIGVASNKLVAKIANNVGKQNHQAGSPPMAIMVVHAGEESNFLNPLPVGFLWGVGPKTEEKLSRAGIKKIGELAAIPPETLISQFGKMGRALSLHARGIDDRPVENQCEVKSISHEMTFEKDQSDPVFLKRRLREMSGQVCYRLRQKSIYATTVKIKIRWPNFDTWTRQVKLEGGTNQDDVVYRAALDLFLENWGPKKAVRLLGVGVSGFMEIVQQLPLWETQEQRETRLLNALDDLRGRFGNEVVTRGNLLG